MGDGDEPEAGQGRVGGLDLVEADGGQVAQQGVEAVYWQVVWVCLVASAVPAGSGWRGRQVLDRLCVLRIASTALTSRVGRPAFRP